MKVEHAKRLDEQDHGSLVLWATDCAEHVLPYFEKKYPKDDRPRKALEAGRAWVRGEIALSEARAAAFAAHAAAREADQAAARAAGHAAATAHVAGHTPFTLPPTLSPPPPTPPLPPPRNVIGSTDAFRSTFGQ